MVFPRTLLRPTAPRRCEPAPLRTLALAAVLIAGLVSGWVACRSGPGEPVPLRAALTVEEVLGGAEVTGYARATSPRTFDFPTDHGSHPAFRSEWWYFTGNLETAGGRHFGYQLTFFRNALAPAMPERSSTWATRQAYMAHLTLTDVEAGRFHAFERFSRGALGLAGARGTPFRVWLDDWSAERAEAGPDTATRSPSEHRPARSREAVVPSGARSATASFPWRLRAAEDEVAIDLTIEPLKPTVLHGNGGLSQKGNEPGNASYYYSLTRLRSRGNVRLGPETFQVEGLSWLDREWSTSALEAGEVGWDWFGLQLSDGSELMFYRLRRRDGSISPRSGGTLVHPGGSVSRLGVADVIANPAGRWQSPDGGQPYPTSWQILVPLADLELEVTPYVNDQELKLAFRYWEGAVRVTGLRAGVRITGSGYLELTGYADTALPR